MWPKTAISERLGLAWPLIQAPMAAATTPALAAAVSEAGGLGSLGVTMLTAEQYRAEVAAARERTSRPLNVNFFVHPRPSPLPEATARMRERLRPYYEELGLGEVPEAAEPAPPFDEPRLQAVLETRPEVVSFHFGLPAPAMVAAIKAAGLQVWSSATTVAEARWLEAHGCDAIIAQGLEAGGHRGTFLGADPAAQAGTMALVPQIVDAVSVPVVAAGGITDGRGIAAALMLGAAAVQMGTAFLLCPETKIPPAHRERLRRATDDGTRLTTLYSGRPARGLVTRFMDELADLEGRTAPFPTQNALTGPLRTRSPAGRQTDFVAHWSGQAAALARELPAAELVRRLAEETEQVLREGR
jgi:nitronate monooxygenase